MVISDSSQYCDVLAGAKAGGLVVGFGCIGRVGFRGNPGNLKTGNLRNLRKNPKAFTEVGTLKSRSMEITLNVAIFVGFGEFFQA